MQKKILPLITFILLILTIIKLDDITAYTTSLVGSTPSVAIEKANTYYSDADYFYVQKSVDFVPYNKQDLLNILYSIFNNGYDTFTFYCPSEYTECIDDIEEIGDDKKMITDVGNYVHPYNNFTKLKFITNNLGEVDVVITDKMYTSEMIDSVNRAMDEMFQKVITDDMSLEDKVLKIHDYIIDNTYYDQNNGKNAGNAYGALIEGKAKCSGYADAMAIALSRLGIKNYKVASDKHVWNAAYINGEWSHIDLTWDDPIVVDGGTITDTIRHKFFMIDTETLLSYDTDEHSFDPKVYLEMKK